MTPREQIVVISIGSPLRGDDGVAQAVCSGLPQAVLAEIKLYDLELKTQMIGQCLQNARAALIVDATRNGTAAGSLTILDLHPLLNSQQKLSLRSCHSLSFLDELKILAQEGQALPEQLVFLGIEASDRGWQEGLSAELHAKLPELRQKLKELLETF